MVKEKYSSAKKKTLETMNKHTPPQNAASIHLIYETTVTLYFL